MNEQAILITGASSEVGGELITRLSRWPNPPLILAHCFQGAERIEALATKLGSKTIVAMPADFRDVDAAPALAKRILEEYGAPGGIAHLPAARLRYERLAKLDWSRFEADMAIQVRSITQLLQVLGPHLRRPKAGPERVNAKIVIVGSSVTLGMPPKYMAAYTTAKYALLGLARAAAAEYGEEGVQVNVVSPSMVETQFLREIPAKAVELAAQTHPMRRNARVGDVAPLIEYLLSPESDYLNGVNIPVTGGLAV